MPAKTVTSELTLLTVLALAAVIVVMGLSRLFEINQKAES